MKKYFLALSLLVIYTSSCAQQFGNVQEPISSIEVEAREPKEATEITEPHEKKQLGSETQNFKFPFGS